MWLRVLGPVQVWDGSAWRRPPRPQLRLLLACLALSAGRVVPVDDLIDVLWEERPPPSARASLQVLVVRLRKTLAGLPGCSLERYGDGYQLLAAPDRVDVHRFRSLVSSARKAPDGGDAIEVFGQALALWRGPALADVPGTARVEAIRAGLAEEQLSAVQDRFSGLLAAGRDGQAAEEIPLVLAGHPLTERLAGLLMIAWYRCGRQADALRVFRDLRARLAGEPWSRGGNCSACISGFFLGIRRWLRQGASPGCCAAARRPPRLTAWAGTPGSGRCGHRRPRMRWDGPAAGRVPTGQKRQATVNWAAARATGWINRSLLVTRACSPRRAAGTPAGQAWERRLGPWCPDSCQRFRRISPAGSGS
jgi:DNA-binding SARP family transcriptional activator